MVVVYWLLGIIVAIWLVANIYNRLGPTITRWILKNRSSDKNDNS